MGDVRLIPLGVGDAFTAKHYTTCLALGVDDTWLLIECPHPIRKMLREGTGAAGIPFDIDQIKAVAITHLHADHCSGLEDFAYYSYFAVGRRTRLAMHPLASAKLWNGLLAAGMAEVQMDPHGPIVTKQLHDYFEMISLDALRPVEVGPFTIECRRTIHPVPTTAFRIRVGNRTLAFSADTAYDPGLITWLDAADLIIHEVTNHKLSTVHTPYEALVALPAATRDKIRLIHYPDDFDLANSLIEPLIQGRVYSV